MMWKKAVIEDINERLTAGGTEVPQSMYVIWKRALFQQE